MELLKRIILPKSNNIIKKLILKLHGILILVLFIRYIEVGGYHNGEHLDIILSALYFYVALVGGINISIVTFFIMIASQVLVIDQPYIKSNYFIYVIIIKAIIILFASYLNLKFREIIIKEKEQKSIFLDVIDDMPYLIGLYDDDNMVFANKRLLKRAKLETKSVKGIEQINLEEYMDRSEFKRFIELEEDFKNKDTFYAEGIFNISFNVHPRKYRIILSKLIYKNKNVIMKFLIDVTKESIAEEKLKIAETEYKKMMDNLPDSIILHKQNNMIFVNKATLELFGADRSSQMIGKSIVDFVEEPYKESTYLRFKTLQSQVNLRRRELNMITLRNDMINVEANTNLFTYDTSYAVTVIKDITKEKQLEKDRENLNLKITYDQWKSEIFANIAHELKTPVGVIYSLLQLLDIDCEELDTDEGKADLLLGIESIRKNCRRQLRLIENFIDVTLIESKNITIRKEIGNIIEAIEDLVAPVAEYAKEKKDINIIFDTEIEEVLMDFDFNKIQRILLNLFSNSIKFCERGSTIEISIYKGEKFLRILVVDDGIGIPESKVKYVFDRFRQVDKSFTRRTEGSGLGLFIAKGLVEAMEGSISISSDNGIGTSVDIKLPLPSVDNKEILEAYYNNEYQREYIDSSTMHKIRTEF